MSDPTTPAAQTITAALQIAAEAVAETITSEAYRQQEGAIRWWDIRPMIDERRHPEEAITRHTQRLAYGLLVGILQPHPDQDHLVRLTGC